MGYIYKNWSCGWNFKNCKNCEYGIVEVLEISDPSLTVSYLTKVDCFCTAFMPERKESATVMKILECHDDALTPDSFIPHDKER
jgi:hypothetical protein